MLVLLPPSEGKAEPAAGRAGRPRRARLRRAARGQAARRRSTALDPGLLEAPAAPAAEVYTGVLYERLELPELPVAARRRVLIASALWGVVAARRPHPRLPLPPKPKLDGIGPPANWWRPALAEALPDEEGELIVDMRSAAYAAAWKPKRATLLAVRAFSERDGERKPISHMAKAVRGDVARALLLAKKPPVDPAGAAAIAERAGFAVELSEPAST